MMDNDENTELNTGVSEASESIPEEVQAPPKRGRGRPRKNPQDANASPRRRGRPPKSSVATNSSKRGRPPKALSLVMELERQIETRYQRKIEKAQEQIKALKDELKASKQREKAALKLFEKQQKAMAKFVANWSNKELAKVQKAGETKRKRGRPRKNPAL